MANALAKFGIFPKFVTSSKQKLTGIGNFPLCSNVACFVNVVKASLINIVARKLYVVDKAGIVKNTTVFSVPQDSISISSVSVSFWTASL